MLIGTVGYRGRWLWRVLIQLCAAALQGGWKPRLLFRTFETKIDCEQSYFYQRPLSMPVHPSPTNGLCFIAFVLIPHTPKPISTIQ